MNTIDTLLSNVVSVCNKDDFINRITQQKSLRIKLGVDPTRPDLTLGHMVVFNKLRQFQDHGHTAVLIIGDFTTLIGDPTGRSSTRPILSKEEISKNASTYIDQAFKILDPTKTEIHYNSEWFNNMSFFDLLSLSRTMTVSRMLDREDFSNRYTNNIPISIIEFLYPLVQGYDSYKINADVEIGGTDQTFNCLVGRDVQRSFDMKEQIVMTLPILVGTDGVKKMSKSYDNYISLNDTPRNFFGKLMSISDNAMKDYFRLLLLKTETEISNLFLNNTPFECKKILATELTNKIHGDGIGISELENFVNVFSNKQLPTNIPELVVDNNNTLKNIINMTGAFASKNEVHRLIVSGSVTIDQKDKITDPNHVMNIPASGTIIQIGKRQVFKFLPINYKQS